MGDRLSQPGGEGRQGRTLVAEEEDGCVATHLLGSVLRLLSTMVLHKANGTQLVTSF